MTQPEHDPTSIIGIPFDNGTAAHAILDALTRRGVPGPLAPSPDPHQDGVIRMRRPDDQHGTIVIFARIGAWSYQTFTGPSLYPNHTSGDHDKLDDIVDDIAAWLTSKPRTAAEIIAAGPHTPTGPRMTGQCDRGEHDQCDGVRHALQGRYADQPCECPHHRAATVTLTDTVQADHLAGMPQLAGNGHHATAEPADPASTTVRLHLPAGTLDVLAGLPDDHDGHYDGTFIWIAGTPYAVDHDDELR